MYVMLGVFYLFCTYAACPTIYLIKLNGIILGRDDHLSLSVSVIGRFFNSNLKSTKRFSTRFHRSLNYKGAIEMHLVYLSFSLSVHLLSSYLFFSNQIIRYFSAYRYFYGIYNYIDITLLPFIFLFARTWNHDRKQASAHTCFEQ